MYKIHSLEVKIFLEVAKEGNFTKAADQLFIAQPTITKWIKHLEQELGIQLFFRNSKQVRLTTAGEALFKDWSSLHEKFETSIENAKKMSSCDKQHIHIGALYGFDFEVILKNQLKEFEANHFHINVDFSIYDFQKLRTIMDSLDIILTTSYEMNPSSEYEQIFLSKVPLCLAVSSQHPLSTKESLTLADIKDEDFLVFSSDSSPWAMNHLRKAFMQQGYTPNLIPVDNIPSQFLSIARNKGIAIVYSDLKKIYGGTVVFIPMEDVPLEVHRVLCYKKKNETKELRELIHCLTIPFRNH